MVLHFPGYFLPLALPVQELLVLLPAAYLLSLSGRLEMVWWSFPIAEIASVMVTSVLMLRIYRQKLRPLVEEQKALGV